MSQTTIVAKFQADGIPVDPDSILLSDEGATYGVKRLDTSAVVVAAGTPVTKITTGTYSYTFTDPEADLTYQYSFEVVYNNVTTYYSGTVEGGSDTLDIALTNYLTEAEANTYMSTYKISTASWDSATSAQKVAALTLATRSINHLPFIGNKTDDTQVNAFPRGGDTTVPQDIIDACAELAFAYVEGKTNEQQFEDLKVVSKKFGPVSITSTEKVAIPYAAAGIVSYDAWVLLLPYLRTMDIITVERIN